MSERHLVFWMTVFWVIFSFVFILRHGLLLKIVNNSPFHLHVKRQFVVEISMFFLVTILYTIYSSLFYGYPAGSGAKVGLGCALLGFFAALDLALERERNLSKKLILGNEDFKLREKYFPLPFKLTLTAALTVTLVTTVFIVVIARDIYLLMEISGIPDNSYLMSMIFEIVFIGVVVLAEMINLITSYSMNLKLFLTNENNALYKVEGGDLDSRVVVSSNDEFGSMAMLTNRMIESLRERTKEVQVTQDVTILTLASLAETRDNETGAHIMRTQRYVRALAEYLAKNPEYEDFLTESNIDLLFKSAPLHDIGKVGVRDSILLKPGKLTNEEFEEMKRHTEYGKAAIAEGEKILGTNSFLGFAGEIAYTHHEKWDGSGYPRGLGGEDIPLSGRLMALADVYDALISKRVYKEAFSHEKTKEIIIQGREKHFDPSVVDAFIGIEQTFIDIAANFSDKKRE